jgi:Fe2+ or Zn2+ uptake regulation protein
MANLEQYKERMIDAGLRPTPQRVAIAQLLFEELDHPTVDEIMRGLSDKDMLVSQATVYNTLNTFVAQGVVQEVCLGDGRTVYDHNIDAHHHFIDEETQRIFDVSCSDVHLAASYAERVSIQSIQVVIRGKIKGEWAN